jgi:hypothetical protein
LLQSFAAGVVADRQAACTVRCCAQHDSGSKPERQSKAVEAARQRSAAVPQMPQQPTPQRPEHFVQRGPAAPPKVDPITAALEREASEAPRGRGRRGKASGMRHGKGQELQAGQALAGWRVKAQRAGGCVSSINKAMVQLQHVSGAHVEADASGVMRDALQLLQSDVDAGDGRLASFLDALGSAVRAHEPLAAAMAADADASAQIARALDRAAQQDATYTNGFCTAQMATAQDKLQQYCARFWRELERTGLQHAGPREVATVLHRAGVLAADHGAPAPNEGLWIALETGILLTATQMRAQQVSNCWCACAKLAHKPQGLVRETLTEALLRVCHSVAPMNVSNTLWAFAKRNLPPRGELQAALLSACAPAPACWGRMLQTRFGHWQSLACR